MKEFHMNYIDLNYIYVVQFMSIHLYYVLLTAIIGNISVISWHED